MKNHATYRIDFWSGHSEFTSNSFFIVNYKFVMTGVCVYIKTLKAIITQVI